MRRTGPGLAIALAAWLVGIPAGSHEEEPDPGPGPSSAALSEVPCEGGFADVYPCANADLLAYVPLEALGGTAGVNDVWGWTHAENGHEYVLLGVEEGTAFVDVSDPTSPVYLGILPTHTAGSSWRDIRTHADHAFIVSEAPGHGMQVFDLHRLEDVQDPPVVFDADAHYGLFGDAHNVSVNELTGFAYVVGANSCSRGLHMVDVSDPLAPAFAGCFSDDGYTHDVQCVVYMGPDPDHGGREICFASNEDTLTIVDVTDKQAPVQLSRTGYAGVGYTHQGWLTSDQRHFLLGDELDELDFGHPARTYVWDVSDLDAPFVTGFYEGPTGAAIDHNLFVAGDHVHQAHYTAGVRFRRIGDLAAAELSEVAFFDTAPEGDATIFSGAWGVFPFFPSGTVAASDIGRGLFLLSPDLGAVPACDDGIDNDGDGLADAGADPACRDALDPHESAQCQNGLDDDGDGRRDFDGGASILGGGHPDVTDPDPQCVGVPWRRREAKPRSCGIGAGLALVLPLLGAAHGRRRSRRSHAP